MTSICGMPGPAGHTAIASREALRLKALASSGLLDTLPEPAFDRVTRLAARTLAVPVALVSLVTAERQFFKSARGLPEPWASRRQTPLSHSFCQLVVRDDAPLVIEDARSHPLVCDNLAVRDLGVVGYCGVPLRSADGHALGALCAITGQPRDWSPDDIATLDDLAKILEGEIALREAVLRDPLTGLANRRRLGPALDAAVRARAGTGKSTSLLLLDLDRFKQVNDRHGHDVGDQLLKVTAARLQRAVRVQDIVARLGGDEFAILLEGEVGVTGEQLKERLMETVSQPAEIGALKVSVGISIGEARHWGDTASSIDLMVEADADLYRCKAARRAAAPEPVATH